MEINEPVPLFEIKRTKTKYKAVHIKSSDDAFKFAKKLFTDEIEVFESCYLILLNTANITIGHAKVSQGGIAGTVVCTKLIAKYCINNLASGVILAHNHPSGKLSPSKSDISTTKKVKDGLKTLDIDLLDHLIVTNKGYYSINVNGKMNG